MIPYDTNRMDKKEMPMHSIEIYKRRRHKTAFGCCATFFNVVCNVDEPITHHLIWKYYESHNFLRITIDKIRYVLTDVKQNM